MREIESRARDLGYSTLYLETGPAQPEALALYRTNGWIEIDRYPEGVFCHPQAHWFEKAL
jgi:hypothetical protein